MILLKLLRQINMYMGIFSKVKLMIYTVIVRFTKQKIFMVWCIGILYFMQKIKTEFF